MNSLGSNGGNDSPIESQVDSNVAREAENASKIYDETIPHPNWRGTQRKVFFDNGYGASIVCATATLTQNPYSLITSLVGKGPSTGSYGGERGLSEVAVLKGTPEDWDLTYDTDLTDDVIGNLSGEEVDALLVQISELPAEGAK